VSSDHVSRDIPAKNPAGSHHQTLHPWSGYWLELDLATRFCEARDRRAARHTNARFAQLNAQPFGTPADPNRQPEPMDLQEPAA
jgi:hypothetical protein